MEIVVSFDSEKYVLDLEKCIDLSLPITDLPGHMTCFYAEPIDFQTIQMGDFIGNTALGGVCNYKKITLTPHGNTTHTETFWHITNLVYPISQAITQPFFKAKLITLPVEHKKDGDYWISYQSFLDKIDPNDNIDALIIRSSPNSLQKKTQQYSGKNPPYLDHRITHYLAEKNIKHLLIDLPSVDREDDDAAFLAHKAFWRLPDSPRENATITELIFVPDSVADGLYLLSLQVLNITLDASPSRPLLFELKAIN